MIPRAAPAQGLLALWLVVASPLASAAERNVLLFVADDLGLEVGAYGHAVAKTPAMDRLAADGALFRYAFCTTASCSASRSVILTGLQNHANGQYGHAHSFHHFATMPSVRSLPALLRSAGYRTHAVGKIHVSPPEVYPFDGYDLVEGDRQRPVSPRDPRQMAAAARSFLSRQDDRPFFLYFCPADPHRSGARDERVPTRPDRFGNGARGAEGRAYDPKDVLVPPFLPDSPEARAELAQYHEAAGRVDTAVGLLVGILQELGLYDKTLIIVISDNGIAFAGAKTTLYEPGMRLPCIVRNPYEKRRGVEVSAMVSWVDLTPTILEFAGAKGPEYPLHGRSFLADVGDPDAVGPDQVFASHTFHEVTMYYPMRVLRTRRWKLIWNIASPLPFPFATDLWESPTWQAALRGGDEAPYGVRTVRAYVHRPRFELYDLQKDPNEATNLADLPEHAERLADLKRRLRAEQERTRDPWLLKWTYE